MSSGRSNCMIYLKTQTGLGIKCSLSDNIDILEARREYVRLGFLLSCHRHVALSFIINNCLVYLSFTLSVRGRYFAYKSRGFSSNVSCPIIHDHHLYGHCRDIFPLYRVPYRRGFFDICCVLDGVRRSRGGKVWQSSIKVLKTRIYHIHWAFYPTAVHSRYLNLVNCVWADTSYSVKLHS